MCYLGAEDAQLSSRAPPRIVRSLETSVPLLSRAGQQMRWPISAHAKQAALYGKPQPDSIIAGKAGTADVNSHGPQEPCLPPEMTSCWLLPSAFMIQIPPDAVHEMWEPSGDQEGS